MKELFRMLARQSSDVVGSPWSFIAAAGVCVVWAATGPIFGFSDAWQLVINTVTNIATFLVLFLIQNTQNRDAKAIHLKLDELLRGVRDARTGLIRLENLSDEQLENLRRQFDDLKTSNPEQAIERMPDDRRVASPPGRSPRDR